MIDCETRGPFRETLPLVLASASPRRQKLLASLGIGFEVVPSRMKEPPPLPEETPTSYALKIAEAKAQNIASRISGTLILSADTIVVIDGKILGKPRDTAHAMEMLTMLSGRTHSVITGCCILPPGDGQAVLFSASTAVTMDAHPSPLLQAYIDSGEPFGKAGAYAIQGVGGVLVREIKGSYTNVVGLPLAETAEQLIRCSALEIASGNGL
ncbi:MAG: Maf family protein [Desulfovibrionales bacterium]